MLINTCFGSVEAILYNPSQINHRPVIVFVHGTPGSILQSEVYCEDVIQAGYPVLAWNRPGYGETELIKDVNDSVAKQADLLYEVIQAFGLSVYLLHGVSSGGLVVKAFYNRFGRQVAGVILESAVTRRYNYRDRTLYQAMADALMTHPIGSRVLRWLNRSYPVFLNRLILKRFSGLSGGLLGMEARLMYHDPVIRNRLNKLMDPKEPYIYRHDGLDNDFSMIRKPFDEDTTVYRCPTLVLHGTADSDVPISETDYIEVSHAIHQNVPIINGSHLLPLSARHRYVSEAKASFLKRL